MFLEKCLDSIKNQSYKNIEVLLIDDGSTDNSGKICDSYSLSDNRFKVFHKNNGGLSSARNYGLDHATGDYYYFVDSDDYLAINLVELCLIKIESSHAEIACVSIDFFSLENNVDFKLKSLPNNVYGRDDIVKMLLTDELGSQVVRGFFSKKCWENLSFPFGRLYEDIPTTYKAFYNSNNIVFVNEAKYFYRNNINGISRNKNNKKSFHIFLGFYDHFVFAQQHYPEIINECCCKAGIFAISSLFYHYSKSSNESIFLVVDFLKTNKKTLLRRKSNFTRKFLLFLYVYLKPFFVLGCKVYKIFEKK